MMIAKIPSRRRNGGCTLPPEGGEGTPTPRSVLTSAKGRNYGVCHEATPEELAEILAKGPTGWTYVPEPLTPQQRYV